MPADGPALPFWIKEAVAKPWARRISARVRYRSLSRSEKCQTPVAVGYSDVINEGTDGRVLVACDTAQSNWMPRSRMSAVLLGEVSRGYPYADRWSARSASSSTIRTLNGFF